MNARFIPDVGATKCNGSKVSNFITQFIVPKDHQASFPALHGMVDAELRMASITVGWKVRWSHAKTEMQTITELLCRKEGLARLGGNNGKPLAGFFGPEECSGRGHPVLKGLCVGGIQNVAEVLAESGMIGHSIQGDRRGCLESSNKLLEGGIMGGDFGFTELGAGGGKVLDVISM